MDIFFNKYVWDKVWIQILFGLRETQFVLNVLVFFFYLNEDLKRIVGTFLQLYLSAFIIPIIVGEYF